MNSNGVISSRGSAERYAEKKDIGFKLVDVKSEGTKTILTRLEMTLQKCMSEKL
jgi:hypothetical protein